VLSLPADEVPCLHVRCGAKRRNFGSLGRVAWFEGFRLRRVSAGTEPGVPCHRPTIQGPMARADGSWALDWTRPEPDLEPVRHRGCGYRADLRVRHQATDQVDHGPLTSDVMIDVIRGDITRQAVDAIVNAANSSLMGGGGVDGAIHAAAGPDLMDECREVRRHSFPDGLPPGQAVATTAAALSARFVIHTVGPKYWEYPDGGEDVLAAAYRNSLIEAEHVGATSVAFPAISCGVYGWTPRNAAPIAIAVVRGTLAEIPSIRMVRFVLFNDDAYEAFSHAVADS